MSSLATLAHAATPPPSAFNSAFYTTVATVIPVLFLAIAIQGSTYQQLLLAYATRARAYRRRMRAAKSSGRLTLGKALIGVPGVHLPGFLAASIVIAGLYGEGAALDALYEQQTAVGIGFLVFVATIYLVAVAASGPISQYQRMTRLDRAAREQEARADRPPEPQSDAEKEGASARPDATAPS